MGRILTRQVSDPPVILSPSSCWTFRRTIVLSTKSRTVLMAPAQKQKLNVTFSEYRNNTNVRVIIRSNYCPSSRVLLSKLNGLEILLCEYFAVNRTQHVRALEGLLLSIMNLSTDTFPLEWRSSHCYELNFHITSPARDTATIWTNRDVVMILHI